MSEDMFKHKHLFAFTTYLDTDHDGVMTWNDFKLVAEFFTMTEGGGIMNPQLLEHWTSIFRDYYDNLCAMCDYNKDGIIEYHEWMKFFQIQSKTAKCYDDLPKWQKTSVDMFFKTMDINKDGKICIDDFKKHLANNGMDITRAEACFNPMLNASDKANGNALSLKRFQELLFEFYTSKDPKSPGNWVLGPYDSKSFEEIHASLAHK